MINSDKFVHNFTKHNKQPSGIYFPDGEYMISKPLCTSSDAKYAVSLNLSNFAVIKATKDWSSDEAMIRLGALNKKFTIWETGTNYYLAGGCIDGSGIAKGVSIDGGRETCIRNLSIKFVTQGLNVKYNKEYGSNDLFARNVGAYITIFTEESMPKNSVTRFLHCFLSSSESIISLRGDPHWAILPLYQNAR